MSSKLEYKWHLRELMATRGMFSTTAIRPLLAERGVTLSPTQIWRLVTEKPERMNIKVLVALMDILDCRMDELIEPVAAQSNQGRKAAGDKTATSKAAVESGLGTLRPKRARIAQDKR